MSQLPHSIPGIVPNGDGGYVWADPIKRAESNARHAARHAAFIEELNAERNARKAEGNARKAERNAMYAARKAERNASKAERNASKAERNARKAERNARSAATRKAAQNDLPTGGKRKSKRNNRKNRSTMKKRRG
jgi:hypothetical protein